MFYVYGLHLEGDDEIRYVGSSCNPRKRFWQHLCDSHSRKYPDRWEWIQANRDKVRVKILASTEKEGERRRLEDRVIHKYSGQGHRLFNERRASEHMATPEDVTWWLDYLGDHEVK